jgi:hypothetical protein
MMFVFEGIAGGVSIYLTRGNKKAEIQKKSPEAKLKNENFFFLKKKKKKKRFWNSIDSPAVISDLKQFFPQR